jgi:hypothetical protein
MCILSVALKSLWQQTVPTRVGISSVFPPFLFFSYPGDTSERVSFTLRMMTGLTR